MRYVKNEQPQSPAIRIQAANNHEAVRAARAVADMVQIERGKEIQVLIKCEDRDVGIVDRKNIDPEDIDRPFQRGPGFLS